MKNPFDLTPYERHPKSRKIYFGIADGTYVYVQDEKHDIYVLPDGPHLHPKILGHANPARYAGDLTILDDKIKDVTNLSGTFQFSDAQGLLKVVERLEEIGFVVLPGAVRLFDYDNIKRPEILR